MGVQPLKITYWTPVLSPRIEKNDKVLCIPKKGNLAEWYNMRGITLKSNQWKIYCKIILNWMHDTVDNGLWEEQTGFHTKCPCTEQIFTLWQIIEKWEGYQVPLNISYIDFMKALDSVHRPSLWKILKSYGFPGKAVSAIEQICIDSKCPVRMEEGYTEWLDCLMVSDNM